MAMYGRLGKKANVTAVEKAVKAAGGKCEEKDKELMHYTIDGETAFRAICKGGDTWMILYNDKFFPKPE